MYSSPEFKKREVILQNFKTWNYRRSGTTIEMEDATLAPGQRKLIQGSAPGLSGSFERIVKENGNIILTEKFTSSYRPFSAIYRVGPSNT